MAKKVSAKEQARRRAQRKASTSRTRKQMREAAAKKARIEALRKRAQELENELLEEEEGEGATVEVITDDADILIEARKQARRRALKKRAMSRKAQEEEPEPEEEPEEEPDEVEARRAYRKALRAYAAYKKAQEEEEPEEPEEEPEEVEAKKCKAQDEEIEEPEEELEEEIVEAQEEEKEEEEEPEEEPIEARKRAARARALRKARRALRKKRAQEVSDDLTGPEVDPIDIPQEGFSGDLVEGEADDMVQQTEAELPDSINEAEDKVLAAYRLIDAQIAQGVVPSNVKKHALASKYAKKFTTDQMKLAAANLAQVGSQGKQPKAKGGVRVSSRKAMPYTKSASKSGDMDDACLFF